MSTIIIVVFMGGFAVLLTYILVKTIRYFNKR